MKESIAPRNMISREDFLELERRCGGPIGAAERAGVDYTTWWRWREGRIALKISTQKHLAMMLQTCRLPFQQSAG